MPKLIRCTGQMGAYWKPASEQDAVELAGINELTVAGEKTRTGQQNKSMWKYCQDLADALNAAGYDMRTFPWKEGLELPFTKTACMERFWRPVMDAMAGLDSTTEQSTKDVMAIYAAVDRAISSKTGVTVEWPCRETQMRRVA